MIRGLQHSVGVGETIPDALNDSVGRNQMRKWCDNWCTVHKHVHVCVHSMCVACHKLVVAGFREDILGSHPSHTD